MTGAGGAVWQLGERELGSVSGVMSDSEVDGGVEREAGDRTGSVSAGLCRRGEMETTSPGTKGAV